MNIEHGTTNEEVGESALMIRFDFEENDNPRLYIKFNIHYSLFIIRY